MSANPRRWVMTAAGEPLVAAESGIDGPGPDQAVVEIETCALWCGDFGYQFGDAHTGQPPSHALRHQVSGHVVEAGADALYYTDRAVVLAVIPPKAPGDGCGFGAATICPSTHAPPSRTDRCGNSIIVPACVLHRALTTVPGWSRSGRASCTHC